MDLHHWVNDGVMAVFFFVIGLEVRRELSVGELTDRRRVRLPLVAGLAGMAVPAVLYLALNPSGEAANGWGIVIGTDTAFMLGALAVVGPTFSTQLRIFLLTLTVIDDIVAVTVIGVVYSESISLGWLALALAGLVVLGLLDRVDVRRAAPYVVVVLVLWLATVNSGLHSSIAGMVGGLLISSHDPRRETVEGAAQRFRAFRQSPMPDLGRWAARGVAQSISVNERLQSSLHLWTSYLVVPLFALANTGVDLGGGVLGDALRSPVTWGIVAGLVLGKPIGITAAVLLGRRGRDRAAAAGVETGHVAGGAALSGIGFTVSLLITDLAFEDEALQDQAVVAILLSAVLATVLGWLLFLAGRVMRGEGDADLPRFLDRDVDPRVDHVRGPVEAPLTLVEYGDFECPFCAKATGMARELRERLGDDLRYVFRHLPLTDVHPHAELAARGALAADRQGRFWDMHDLLFAHQDELEVEDLVGYAGDLRLDTEQFLRDLEDDALDARLRADVASAEASGARGHADLLRQRTPAHRPARRREPGPGAGDLMAGAVDATTATARC